MNLQNRRQIYFSSIILSLVTVSSLNSLEAQTTYIAPVGDTSYVFIAPPLQEVSTSPTHAGGVPLAPFTDILINSATVESDNTQTITQNIQIGAASGTIASGTGNLTTTLSGNITGTSALVFGYVNSAGTFVLTGNNSGYTGTVLINNDTTVQAGSATALSPSAFTVNGTLDLAANSSTITGLAGSGTVESTIGAATLTVNNAVANTFAGSLTDGGGTLTLAKTGSGTLTLTGASNYTGGTTISAGTLQIGSGGTTGSITGAVVDNAALAFDRSDSITFPGVISGTGSLSQIGTGTLTLTAANSFGGGTTITDGTLVVGNSSALGTGNVVNNAALTTNSTVTGLPVNIGGNYTQGAAGSLTLNLYGLNSFDTVNLTSPGGVAHLNGTLDLDIHQTIYPGSGDVFHVLTSSNTIASPFSSVVTNMPALPFNVYYTTDVVIQFPFATGGLTHNQTAVANYLDSHDITITNVAFGKLITALNNLAGPSGLGRFFDQLTTVNFAQFTSSIAFNNTSFLTQQMDDYLASHRGRDGLFIASVGGIDYSALTVNDQSYLPGLQQIHSRLLAWNPAPSTGLLSDSTDSVIGGVDMKEMKHTAAAAPDEGNRWNAFVSGNAVLAQDFSDSTSGTGHQDLTTEAMQIGIDYELTPNFLVGAMFGYGHTDADLDDMGSSATVDTYSPALYASFTKDGWYANALGSYGFSNYTQSRDVSIGAFAGTANSAPSGDQIVGNLDGGYDFHRGNWTFGPLAGVQYVHLDVDGYSETGLPGADLNVNENEADSLRSRLGGRISYAYQDGGLTFVPHFSVSWQHEFLDQARGITSQFTDVGAGTFNVQTEDPSRDSALVDLGLDAVLNKSVTVFVDYAAQAGQENYFGQSVQAGVKIGF